MARVFEPILADPDPIYAAIDIGIRERGERWSTCANCGHPYQLTWLRTSIDTCCTDCEIAYIDHLMGS